jgi:maltooligosyltrehalose trehalohydrolase
VHSFGVWAPVAERVDLLLHEGTDPTGRGDVTARKAMTAVGGGWWRCQVGGSGHGLDYSFSVGGAAGLPDPRSPWQPQGVHGPSRSFDPSRHGWTDRAWRGREATGSVIYEVHVGTFTPEGTLDAAIARLDHLVDLGVDLVELMPVAAFAGRRGWGYDGVHLYAVHEPYGGPAALQRFVDAAHARGLGVCLDVVYNHLGPSGNYVDRFGPYFTDRHHTPWGSAVNLDGPSSAEVRRWICDNALRWFRDFHVDALRIDAVHALVDGSGRHILAQLSEETRALADSIGRPLSLIAESDLNDPLTVTPTAARGHGMTAQWSDDAHHAVHALITGERQGYYVDFGTPEVLRTVWREAFWHAERFSTFRNGMWGRRIDPGQVSGHRFVAYTQNHDQVGNRATGDRPSAVLSVEELAVAAALVLTSPFTPMVFMGEEWGATTPFGYFTDHDDDLGRAVTTGRREEFLAHGWDAADIPDPQDAGTATTSVLDWSQAGCGRHADLLDWYRQLIRLRRADPDLHDGDLTRTDVTWSQPTPEGARPDWLIVRRGGLRVVCVLTEGTTTIALSESATQVAAFGSPALARGDDGHPSTVSAIGRGVLVARVDG